MAALDRAVAVAQVNGVPNESTATWISDVAVVIEVLLQVERVVAEAGHCLGTADLERGLELAGVRTSRMPLPPPPAEGLSRTG